MLGLYWLMLRKKASYKVNRIFLIAMPIACLLMSVIRLEVYSADNQITPENLMPEIKIEKKIALNNTVKESSINTQETQIEIAAAESSTEETKAETNWAMIFGISIASVSAVLVIIALFYILKIARIKSMMKSEPTDEGYRMVKSLQIKTPFSYQKTIFLPADLDEDSEKLITRHEKAHIAHHHYVDVIVSEFITRILWFNPFIWIARNELRNVHEFEADHEVISLGTNIKKYQTTLLEMVMNETKPVVSGFNHSFIRRRFIEMKKSTAGTLGYVGKAISITAVAAMFCGFTFTSCKANAPEPTGNITFQPGWFVIKGTVDPVIADSAYNVYLGDKYQHLSKDPDTSVVVKNKQWEYKVYLDSPRAGQVAAIFPGGSVCEATIAFTAIPGDTLCLNVHNGFYDTNGTGNKFYNDAPYALQAMRESTNGKTPYLPEIKCEKMWKNVGYKKGSVSVYNTSSLKLSEVYFTDSATILKLTTNDATGNVGFGSRYVLMDNNGKTYNFLHTTLSDPNDNWNKEARVYGDYIYFEPMPMDTKEFTVAFRGDNKNTSMWVKIHDITGEAAPEPNVTIKLSVDSDADVSSLKLYDQLQNMYINEAILNKNEQKTIKTYVDKRESGLLEIFQSNNEIKKYYIDIWEKADFEITIHKDDIELNATSGYYKDWNDAYTLYNKTLKEKGEVNAKQVIREYILESIGTEKANGVVECTINTLKIFDGEEASKLIEEINQKAKKYITEEDTDEETE